MLIIKRLLRHSSSQRLRKFTFETASLFYTYLLFLLSILLPLIIFYSKSLMLFTESIKRSFYTSFLLFMALFACAQENTLNIFPRTYLDFYILESEFAPGKYIDSTTQLGFIHYNCKETRFNYPKNNRMITLRAEFNVDSLFQNTLLYLVALPIDYPCRIYFNGAILAERGSVSNPYTSRIHLTDKYLLAPDKMKLKNSNVIVLQLYPKEGEIYPVSRLFITNPQDAARFVFYKNLFGPKLILALSICGFVFFLFFLTVYITRREYQKQQFLFFALMNLFFLLSFINNIFISDFSNTFLFEKITRISFPVSVYVGICFLIEYTQVFKNKRRLKLIFLLIYLPSIILVLIPDTVTGTIRAYNKYPLLSLLFGTLVMFYISLVYYLKEKSIKSFLLVFVFFLDIVAGFHDGYQFAVLKTKPFIALTFNAVFLINLVIFFILAVDHSRLYHLALNSTKNLEKLNQDLEVLVEKRTQRTIEYAQKLEEANQTKDRFFSIIAHDLKNPFNTLIGYSDILRTEFKEYKPEEILHQLNIIYDTSIKGYNLLENLLKWALAQTNKLIFEPSKVDLHEIAECAINEVAYQCQLKNIRIKNNIPNRFFLVADKNLLNTVVRNLIHNAVKFTFNGGEIELNAKKSKSDILVSIKDNGMGLCENEIENLFRIDKVISKPGTNKESGSGLGLILCKEFIEKHGGKIWVESLVGKGSEFIFTIPQIVI